MDKVQIGDCTLYHGDCKDLDIPEVDAVITDPPYGQSYKVNTFYAGGTRENAVVYFDIACKRIEDAYRQQRLFA
jgi:DNA modification methylase